ncbi:DUF1214 domain-containing protein [Haladaptatus sp. NG-SE-30]
MSNETHETTAESNAEPLRATRRTALRGTGLAGLLVMGVGNASARQVVPGANVQQTGQQPSEDDEPVPVTWANFPRAHCHTTWQSTVSDGGFGQFYHLRSLTPVDEQFTIGLNRDTLYSFGVFDLTEPVTITLPDTGDRYLSMNIQNEDQYGKLCVYDPGPYTITQELTGTRYAGVAIRIFVDPDDPADVRRARQLQDEIGVEQASAGSFEIPNWDQQTREQMNNALNTVVATVDNYSGAYGDVGQVDPVKFFLFSTSGWTGVPQPSEALFFFRTPAQNDGTTPHTLTVEDVPVDGFWSVSVYNRDLFFEKNKYDAYSVNNVTAEQNADGSVTIHFGGDPEQKNFLYTPEGWRYLVRLYEPRKPIINGSYQFPEAQPVE